MRFSKLIILVICALTLSACIKEVGFEAHLLEAIEVNTSRAEVYASLSQNRSRKLSNALLLSEKLLLPTARFFDFRGVNFNKIGIGIIEADFVPMDLEHSAHDMIHPAAPYSENTIAFIKNTINSFEALKSDVNFKEIADHSVIALQEIEQHEKVNELYIPMLKHVIESIGYGAINAISYSCLSDGKTNKLAVDFIKLQLIGLNQLVLFLDKEANLLHQEGIGILVNDLPTIPTLERYFENEYIEEC